MNKKIIGKAALGLAATIGSAYIGLCSYFSYQASQLPTPEQDKLAILIAPPMKWYDYGRYFPGATELYVHRIETAMGKKAIVYDPVTQEDTKSVVHDSSISDMVIAGHGSWDSWESAGEDYIKSPVRNNKIQDPLTGKIIGIVEDEFHPKTGLFLRHTCGLNRKYALTTTPTEEVNDAYIDKLKDAVPAVVDVKVELATLEHPDNKWYVIIREEAKLSDGEKEKIEKIMDYYFSIAVAHANLDVKVTAQLGTKIVTNPENVRGWDYITSPLLFLWDPIPRHMDDQELIAQYGEEFRKSIIATEPYEILGELDYLKTREEEKSWKKIEQQFWQIHWYTAKHRQIEDETQQCIPLHFKDYSETRVPSRNSIRDEISLVDQAHTLDFYGTVRKQCIPFFFKPEAIDDILVCSKLYENQRKDFRPYQSWDELIPIYGKDTQLLSLRQWQTAQVELLGEETVSEICLPDTTVFRG